MKLFCKLLGIGFLSVALVACDRPRPKSLADVAEQLSGQFAAQPSPSVRLQGQNKQVVLSDAVQTDLRGQMVALLESSNFHSGTGGQNQVFTFAGIQQDYRDSLSSGDYLLVTFPSPQRFKTIGGEIVAAEIVWGLHRSGGKNSLFTIDETGRVICHAKYGGELCLQLEKTVAQVSH